MGDSPILGAGSWVDNEVGAAGSTGRGEANLLACSSVMIVEYLRQGKSPEENPGVYQTPAESRKFFEEKGWSTVAAFQTRNPMHRSHEYLTKIAIEICDGVYIHMLLGKLKSGDIPADVRQNAIDALTANYYVKDSIMVGGYPLDMRYAGPPSPAPRRW